MGTRLAIQLKSMTPACLQIGDTEVHIGHHPHFGYPVVVEYQILIVQHHFQCS